MSTAMGFAPFSCIGRQGLVPFIRLLALCLLLSLPFTAPVRAGDTAGRAGDELRILRITPAGEEVPIGRQIVIEFNLPMDQASLSAHISYLAPGGRRIPAVVEAGPDEDASTGETSRKRLWRVHPQQELPVDTPVNLSVESGIAALQGKERGLENRTIDTLTAIPAFRFLGIECTDRENRSFTIEAGAPLAGQPRCLPSGGISLLFSAPILTEAIQTGLQLSPSLVRRHADANPWDEVYSYSQLSEPFSKGKRYSVFLPESLLRAFSEYRVQLTGTSLKDQFGRVLVGDVDMRFATDHRAPDFALLKNMPVLEKGLDTDTHVWTVNLDELDLSYETQAADGGKTEASRVIRPKGPRNASIPVPLEVRKMIGGDSGLVQGHFPPRPEVPGKVPEESWFFAQVTPFQVHLKLGHHNSLVWITDMQNGNPVPGVTVEVMQSTFEGFSRQDKALAAAVTGDDGVAEMAGTTGIDPTLEHVWADGREKPCLFLRCRKDGDMAVLPIRYEYQVASEGANREYIPDWLRPLYGHIHVWGATAQGIYKAGDTVQYKIYVRDQDNLRFTRPPGAGAREATTAAPTIQPGPIASKPEVGDRAGTPPAPRYHLAVVDPMGKVIHEQGDIVLSSFGAVHGEVALPGNGAVGWYRFVLKSNFSKEEWQPIRVLVSDFTPSPFKVGTDLNGEHFQTGDTVEVTSEAKLHAGGPYTDAATRVTATLEPQPLQPDRPELSGYQFDIAETKDGRSPGIQTLYETEGNLDGHGRMDSSFTIAETPVWYGRLTVESSVRDDRGKSVANRTWAACSGRDRFVEVLQQDWTLRQDRAAKLRLVVIIEIPVLPDYLPGFYLSVTVTSPRVENPPGPQGEDLGKPTTRMGYVKGPVKDPCKELQVDIKPEKAVYKPGDEVRVDLQVSPKNLEAGEAPPPMELAVAVLDEAVFDLLFQGRKAFDPYQGFYSLDELDLSNYNRSLEISPSVIGGIDGAFAFLRDYPYGCWEQKLTRAVMAAMYSPLKPYLRTAFSWPDSARAAGETLAMAVEHQAPNGGMVY